MSFLPREWLIREDERAILFTINVGNEIASLCIPDLDVGVIVRPTCKEFTIG